MSNAEITTHTSLEEELEALREKISRLQEENAILSEKAEKAMDMAMVDPLTGLFNRRYLEGWKDNESDAYYPGMLNQAISRAWRNKEPVCIIFIDVNNLKKINDEVEHQAGDKALKKVANAINGAKRTHEPGARWGGDEFTIVTSGNIEDGVVIAERMRALLENNPLQWKGQSIPLSTSIGLAQYNPSSEDNEKLITQEKVQEITDRLLAEADSASYQAKNHKHLGSCIAFLDPETNEHVVLTPQGTFPLA